MLDMSLKRSSLLVLGSAQAGQRVQLKLNEWGEFGKHGQPVELVADGKVDPFLAQASDNQELLSLDDRRLTRLIAQTVMTTRRHDVQPASNPDWLSSLHSRNRELKKALANVDLEGSIDAVLDQPDEIFVQARFEPPKRSGNGHDTILCQGLAVSIGPQGNRVELYTWPQESKTRHVILAPLKENNSVDLACLQERLEIAPDWFDSVDVQRMSPECIRSISDPRLRELTEKADLAQPLSPDALGPGWKYQEWQHIQRFKAADQIIEFDHQNSQLLLLTSKYGKPIWCAPGVLYRNGKFSPFVHPQVKLRP